MANKRGYSIPYKKPRTIKNSIINIDDVFVERGLGNVNWLSIAKNKLTDRELKLLRKRLQIVDRIIIANIQQFIDRNKLTFNFDPCADIYENEIRHKLISSQSVIVSLYRQSIARMLQKWNGGQTVKVFHSFRTYFQNSRRGFDNKKIKMMAIHCWIPLMQLIREFALKAASRLFSDRRFERELQRYFCDYLNALVLKSVFEATWKPPNSRSMWVIPAMSYQAFLKRYKYLRIVLETNPTKNKVIRKQYLRCIDTRHDHLKEAFHGRLNAYLPVPPTTLPQHLPSSECSDVEGQNDYVNNRVVWSPEADTFQTGFANINPVSFNNANPSISYPAIPPPANENKEYFATQPQYASNVVVEPLRVDGSKPTSMRSRNRINSAVWSPPEDTFKTGFANPVSFNHTNPTSHIQRTLPSISYPAIPPPANENKEYFRTEPLRVDGFSSTNSRNQMQSNVDLSTAYYAENTFQTGFGIPFSFGTQNMNQMGRNHNNGNATLEPAYYQSDASNTFAIGSTHQAYTFNIPFQQPPVVDAPNQPRHCYTLLLCLL